MCVSVSCQSTQTFSRKYQCSSGTSSRRPGPPLGEYDRSAWLPPAREPAAEVGGALAGVEHHLLVVAAKGHQPAGAAQLQQLLDHRVGIGSAIDVIAEGDDEVVGCRLDAVEDRPQRLGAAVDVANGKDSHGAILPRAPRLRHLRREAGVGHDRAPGWRASVRPSVISASAGQQERRQRRPAHARGRRLPLGLGQGRREFLRRQRRGRHRWAAPARHRPRRATSGRRSRSAASCRGVDAHRHRQAAGTARRRPGTRRCRSRPPAPATSPGISRVRGRSRMLLAPAQTTATGVRASSVRSAETSQVWAAPRWTPPMPPVANTRMPARCGQPHRRRHRGRRRALLGDRGGQVAAAGLEYAVGPRPAPAIRPSPRPTVGTPAARRWSPAPPPRARTAASACRAVSRLSGRGRPCAISVDSRATTGRRSARRRATSGQHVEDARPACSPRPRQGRVIDRPVLVQPRQVERHRFRILLRRPGVEDDDLLVRSDPARRAPASPGSRSRPPSPDRWRCPPRPATRRIQSTMRPSRPATARPPLARMASSIMKSPTAAGTRRPLAMVWALANGSAKRCPASKARDDRGAAVALAADQPRQLRRPSSQPSSRSSANAFHMPISPVPPPVG